jgi:hypothetical protein
MKTVHDYLVLPDDDLYEPLSWVHVLSHVLVTLIGRTGFIKDPSQSMMTKRETTPTHHIPKADRLTRSPAEVYLTLPTLPDLPGLP